MVRNLYFIVVVLSRVVGIYVCTNAFFVTMNTILMGSLMRSPVQSTLYVSLILSFCVGALLLFKAKSFARAITGGLE
jgi:hypothetical protein